MYLKLRKWGRSKMFKKQPIYVFIKNWWNHHQKIRKGFNFTIFIFTVVWRILKYYVKKRIYVTIRDIFQSVILFGRYPIFVCLFSLFSPRNLSRFIKKALADCYTVECTRISIKGLIMQAFPQIHPYNKFAPLRR